MTAGDQRYRVIVVGLGRIGLGYDLAGSAGCFYSHAGAFNNHPGFELICGVDPVPERREEFRRFTGKPVFESLPAVSTEEKPDLLVVATPPVERLELVQQCLKFNPRLILMEKPLAASVAEGRSIVGLCRKNGAGIFVNYFRRCEPAAIEIRQRIFADTFGAFQSGHVCYSGGLGNNASHFIDLVLYWFGQPGSVGLLGRIERSRSASDPDMDFWLDWQGRRCVFQAVDDSIFSMGQVELVFAKSMLRYEDFGRRIAIHKVENDRDFGECRRLRHKPQLLPSATGKSQWNVADHLYRHLTTGEPLVSTGETALQVLHYCERMKAGCPGE